MKKLLITGGSHSEIPLIQAAKKLGWYVITTGTNIDGLGHKEADEYIEGDFSDKEFVYELAKQKKVDAMVSGCNDFAYLTTTYVCEKMNMPGHDSYRNALIIHHKDSFRNLLHDLRIKSPKMRRIKTMVGLKKAIKDFSFPIMIKPIDLTGGKGVSLCKTEKEAVIAFNDCISLTREKNIIIEEYIEGSNHGASVLLKNNKVVFSVFDDEQYYKNKYLVQGASMPSDSISQAAIFTLINDIEKLAAKLQLVDGLFHVQFIVDKTGYPIMIDPCRRAPGDLYILLARYTTNIDYPEEIVKAETGYELRDSYVQQHNYIARQCIMADRNGRIKNILISELIKKYILYQLKWGKIGDIVSDYMKYKAGILVMKFQNYKEMDEILSNFHKFVKIEMERTN